MFVFAISDALSVAGCYDIMYSYPQNQRVSHTHTQTKEGEAEKICQVLDTNHR